MRLIDTLYFMDIAWASPIIHHNVKKMYLDYHTINLFNAKPIIKSYRKYKIDYYVIKDCIGVYKIYSEKVVWNPVGFVDLG